MAVRRTLRSVLALLGGLGLMISLPLVAAADDTVAFTISDSRIIESSGLAADPGAGGYWTVNDSGDDGVAYGLSTSGEVTGTLKYRADPIDVEAVAMHDGRLYVADIGDNAAERDEVTVYLFADAKADDETVGYRSWDFRYPDGSHDAETLLVADDGRVYIVTKGATGGVYAAPTTPKRSSVNELERVGDAPGLVTDGTFLPGGDRIALLSPLGIEVVDAKSYERVAEADIPDLRQPESLTVSLDGESLLVGSEGDDSPVYTIPIPSGASESATPSPSATPSEGGDDTDESDPADEAEAASTSGQGRARTMLALGLAGLVAVVAGSVVALVRKP